MRRNRKLTAVLIITGSVLVIYSQGKIKEKLVFVILGVVLLMFGLFRIYSGITSEKPEQQSFIKSEEEE